MTSTQSSVPLIVGVQPAGKHLSFPAQGTMTVQVGSSAVVVGVSVKGKVVFYNAPHVTPYTYVFTPAASTALIPTRSPDHVVDGGRGPARSARSAASSASSWAS